MNKVGVSARELARWIGTPHRRIHGDPYVCARHVVSVFKRPCAVLVWGFTLVHPAASMSSRTESHRTAPSAVTNSSIYGTSNDVVAPATHHRVQVGADDVVIVSLVFLYTEHCRSHCTDSVVYVLSITIALL